MWGDSYCWTSCKAWMDIVLHSQTPSPQRCGSTSEWSGCTHYDSTVAGKNTLACLNFFKPITTVLGGAKPRMQPRCPCKIMSRGNLFWWNICKWGGDHYLYSDRLCTGCLYRLIPHEENTTKNWISMLMQDWNLHQNLPFSTCRMLTQRFLFFSHSKGDFENGNRLIGEGKRMCATWDTLPMAHTVYIWWVRLGWTWNSPDWIIH